MRTQGKWSLTGLWSSAGAGLKGAQEKPCVHYSTCGMFGPQHMVSSIRCCNHLKMGGRPCQTQTWRQLVGGNPCGLTGSVSVEQDLQGVRHCSGEAREKSPTKCPYKVNKVSQFHRKMHSSRQHTQEKQANLVVRSPEGKGAPAFSELSSSRQIVQFEFRAWKSLPRADFG